MTPVWSFCDAEEYPFWLKTVFNPNANFLLLF